MAFFCLYVTLHVRFSYIKLKKTDMRKITLPWNELYGFVGRCASNGITRMGLVFNQTIDGRLDKTKPITVIDHLKNTEMGVQKEGLQINVEGNPHNLDFEREVVYVPR